VAVQISTLSWKRRHAAPSAGRQRPAPGLPLRVSHHSSAAQLFPLHGDQYPAGPEHSVPPAPKSAQTAEAQSASMVHAALSGIAPAGTHDRAPLHTNPSLHDPLPVQVPPHFQLPSISRAQVELEQSALALQGLSIAPSLHSLVQLWPAGHGRTQ